MAKGCRPRWDMRVNLRKCLLQSQQSSGKQSPYKQGVSKLITNACCSPLSPLGAMACSQPNSILTLNSDLGFVFSNYSAILPGLSNQIMVLSPLGSTDGRKTCGWDGQHLVSLLPPHTRCISMSLLFWGPFFQTRWVPD